VIESKALREKSSAPTEESDLPAEEAQLRFALTAFSKLGIGHGLRRRKSAPALSPFRPDCRLLRLDHTARVVLVGAGNRRFQVAVDDLAVEADFNQLLNHCLGRRTANRVKDELNTQRRRLGFDPQDSRKTLRGWLNEGKSPTASSFELLLGVCLLLARTGTKRSHVNAVLQLSDLDLTLGNLRSTKVDPASLESIYVDLLVRWNESSMIDVETLVEEKLDQLARIASDRSTAHLTLGLLGIGRPSVQTGRQDPVVFVMPSHLRPKSLDFDEHGDLRGRALSFDDMRAKDDIAYQVSRAKLRPLVISDVKFLRELRAYSKSNPDQIEMELENATGQRAPVRHFVLFGLFSNAAVHAIFSNWDQSPIRLVGGQTTPTGHRSLQVSDHQGRRLGAEGGSPLRQIDVGEHQDFGVVCRLSFGSSTIAVVGGWSGRGTVRLADYLTFWHHRQEIWPARLTALATDPEKRQKDFVALIRTPGTSRGDASGFWNVEQSKGLQSPLELEYALDSENFDKRGGAWIKPGSLRSLAERARSLPAASRDEDVDLTAVERAHTAP